MRFKVIGIGEVLWDMFPEGPQLGGAPANFACHARALGAHGGVITRIGRDQLGREVEERFALAGLSLGMVQVDPQAPTGTVTVRLNGDGVPHYVIQEDVAWDRLEFNPLMIREVETANAICFGSLAQRSPASRSVIQQLLAAAPLDCLRVFDINLRQNYFSQEVIEKSLLAANVLKLNDAELPVLARLLSLAGPVKNQIETLAQRFQLQVVALTRGPEGSLLFQSGEWSDCGTIPSLVVDTVGAGDAFTAALVMGLLGRLPLHEIHLLADEVARYVCTCPGATPPLPKQYSGRFARRPEVAEPETFSPPTEKQST